MLKSSKRISKNVIGTRIEGSEGIAYLALAETKRVLEMMDTNSPTGMRTHRFTVVKTITVHFIPTGQTHPGWDHSEITAGRSQAFTWTSDVDLTLVPKILYTFANALVNGTARPEVN